MSRKYTKIDQYEKQILSILIVRAKPEQKVYLQRLRKYSSSCSRSLIQSFSSEEIGSVSGLCSREPAHRALPACRGTLRTCWGLWAARSDSSSSLYRERSPSFDSSRRSSAGNLPGGKRGKRIPSIVTVRTFFIGKPSFGGFGKFSPKTKSAFLFLFRENSE